MNQPQIALEPIVHGQAALAMAASIALENAQSQLAQAASANEFLTNALAAARAELEEMKKKLAEATTKAEPETTTDAQPDAAEAQP